jgi:hypothetical protein
MLQMSILGMSQRSLRLPTRIAAIHIDPAAHLQKVYALQGTQGSASSQPPACTSPARYCPRSPVCPLSGQRGGEPLSEHDGGWWCPHLTATHVGGPTAAAGADGAHPGEVLFHTPRGGRVPV